MTEAVEPVQERVDEYSGLAFLHDINILIGMINSGIEQLDIPAEQVTEWVVACDERTPHGWHMPAYTLMAEVRMPPRTVNIASLDDDLMQYLDTRDLYMDRCRVQFIPYTEPWSPAFRLTIPGTEIEQPVRPSDVRREIIQAIANFMHEEADERELCPEYDELFARKTRDMNFRPAGRTFDHAARITVRLTVDFTELHGAIDTIKQQLEGDDYADHRAMLYNYLAPDNADIEVVISQWDAEAWRG